MGLPWWERLPRWWRYPFVVGAIAFGAYVLASFRTAMYGTSVRELLASGVIAAIATVPFITATFFDSDWRRSVRRWLLVLFACVAISEAWALPQEVLFARRARARPTIEATEDRWWPFQHHYIGYDPAYGFYGND